MTMTTTSKADPKSVRNLFRGLVDAAKSLGWKPCADARIHHGYARYVDWRDDWGLKHEETVRLTFGDRMVFHLQIRLESFGQTNRMRVVIFGRRVKCLDSATPNTQRATFNSDRVNEYGFWLGPNLDRAEKAALARRLPGPAFPRWNGKHILLGSDISYIVLRRFITALAVIEETKGGWPPGPLPFEPELESSAPAFETRDLDALTEIEEGRVQRVQASRRSRCQKLLGEACEYFRSLSSDGRLRCRSCLWIAPLPTKGEIVQIHHVKQLQSYPREGCRLTLKRALENLAPLCPNCHRVLESRPGGGCYDLEDISNFP